MARFCDIEQGTRAVKVIDLPLANLSGGLQPDTEEQANARAFQPAAYRAVKVGVRALLPFEREFVLCLAAARAKSKGAEAVESSAVYQHALAVYMVAAAYVDPDTKHGQEPQLFFGDTVEQAAEAIRSSRHMTDDIVYYLREHQEIWQDQISPQALTIAEDKLYEATEEAAKSEDFLLRMRPAMRLHFTRTLAAQLLILLADKFSSSSDDTELGSTP